LVRNLKNRENFLNKRRMTKNKLRKLFNNPIKPRVEEIFHLK